MYYVYEEASEAMMLATEDLQEAINYTTGRAGKYVVKNETDFIVYDSNPNITYKI